MSIFKIITTCIIHFILVSINLCLINALICKDNENNDIDWFIIYKIPKIENHTNFNIKNGFGYVYLDSTHKNWSFYDKGINGLDNGLANTMKQLYNAQMDDDFMYLSYNDKSPNGEEHFEMGHTKGILMANRETGIWMVHSLPRFPLPVKKTKRRILKTESDVFNEVGKIYSQTLNNESHKGYGEYVYPENGAWNGQYFFCITFNSTTELLNISQLIYYDTPFIHDLHVPESYQEKNEYLKFLAQIKDVSTNKSSPWYVTNTFQTLNQSLHLHGFAKYGKFDRDIYSDIVAQHYDCDLLSETWQVDHKHIMNSSCKDDKPHVENVKGISFFPQPQFGVEYPYIHFSELIDHSKWAITNSHYDSRNLDSRRRLQDPQVVCLGDLNREVTQKHRSGGLVCFSDAEIWKSFREIVADIEACPLYLKNWDDSISNSIT